MNRGFVLQNLGQWQRTNHSLSNWGGCYDAIIVAEHAPWIYDVTLQRFNSLIPNVPTLDPELRTLAGQAPFKIGELVLVTFRNNRRTLPVILGKY